MFKFSVTAMLQDAASLRAAGRRSGLLSLAYRPMVVPPSADSRAPQFRQGRPLAALLLGALALAGCAQQPQTTKRSKEYFPESIYGRASPRVVGLGQPVPRGGGQYLVGRPYQVAGRQYVPREMNPGQGQVGGASWYGEAFHGRRTANGEVYDMSSVSAAHPTMPLPSYARVTNLNNGRSMIVRVNDRGPYHPGRVVDVSKRVAEALDFRRHGTAQVRVEYVSKAGLAGSDDDKLMATLRIDGRPATIDGLPTSPAVMVAQASPAQTPAQQPQQPAPQAPQPPAAPLPAPALVPAAAARPAVVTGVNPALIGLPPVAPLPPARPFDLQTIPGADVPIMAAPRRTATASASFYAPPSPVAGALERRRPFEGLREDGLKPLR